jgi:hypothetical protein
VSVRFIECCPLSRRLVEVSKWQSTAGGYGVYQKNIHSVNVSGSKDRICGKAERGKTEPKQRYIELALHTAISPPAYRCRA